jgi:hypothetical protein
MARRHIEASWIVCGSASIVIGTNEEADGSEVAWHAAKKIGSRPDMQPPTAIHGPGWRWC